MHLVEYSQLPVTIMNQVCNIIKDIMDHAYGSEDWVTEDGVCTSMKRYTSADLLRVVKTVHLQAETDLDLITPDLSVEEQEVYQLRMSILLLACCGTVLARRAATVLV